MESRQLIRSRCDAATRACGSARRRTAQRGFTLLEIMVVVAIIGILVIGAILSLGATGRDRELEQERDRLAALIAYGRERGAILTLEYGIRLGQHGYRFTFYDNRLMQWSPETVDDTLRPRRLPSGLQIRLSIEGHAIVLDDKALVISPTTVSLPAGSLLGSSGGGAAGQAINSITGSGGIGSISANAGSASGGGLGSGTSGLGSSGGSGYGTGGLGSSSGGYGAGGLGNTSGGSSSGGSSLGTAPDNNMPQVMLLSNGDMNSFILTIERPSSGRSVTLQSGDDGTVKVGDIVEAAQ